MLSWGPAGRPWACAGHLGLCPAGAGAHTALQVLSPVSGEEALQSLAMLLLRRLPHLTPELFVSLSQFIPFMAVSDIARLPPALLANESAVSGLGGVSSAVPVALPRSLAALRTHSARLVPGQKAAFARRLLQAPSLGAVPTWPLGFLRTVLPLLPHLPLPCFLQLTPQQVWGLGDAWQLLHLGLVQGRHVASSLANWSRAAGPEPGHRLGALACFLSPEELQDLAWLRDPRGAVEQSLLACAAAGTLRQHGRVMLALAGLLRSTSLATVSPGELLAWRGVLPEMGVGFLECLSVAQLKALLPRLRPTQLTRAQVSPAWLRGAAGQSLSLSLARAGLMLLSCSALGSLVVGMSCTALQELGREDFLGALRTLYTQPRSLPATTQPASPACHPPGSAGPWGPALTRKGREPSTGHGEMQPPALTLLPLLQRLPAGTELAGEVLDQLGPLVGFLGQESVAHIQPESLLPRLGDLQDTCLDVEVAAQLGQLLLSERALGPPPSWSLLTLQQLGRLIFLLPLESLHAIPGVSTASCPTATALDMVEQLLQSQWDWEQSELGRLCHPPGTLSEGPRPAAQASSAAPVPSCADIRATFPAAWSAAQLAAMAPPQLEDCLGLLGQDPMLRPNQLRAVLGQVQQLWGSSRALEPTQTLLLGRLVTQLVEPELQELLLPDWGALSVLGELDGWSPEQMRAVVSTFLRQCEASARDLGLPELVALGHLLCGLPVAELWGLDSWELSKAAPFLGSLSLRCTEQQAEVLAAHLTSSAAFGPADIWGPEIFAEVGTLAAGLPDIVLSALVPEQLWALTPRAIAAVPAPKFAVVFGPAQLRTLSSAQAAAVTLGQRQWLGSAQRRALASAQCEGEAAQDSQGESGGVASVPWQLLVTPCPCSMLQLQLPTHMQSLAAPPTRAAPMAPRALSPGQWQLRDIPGRAAQGRRREPKSW
uniref:Stereocilin LRR domain-containing protein n=1 Tax=Athene cunicularia TaxID=194338 RepID=A0A663MPA8_ATHCN